MLVSCLWSLSIQYNQNPTLLIFYMNNETIFDLSKVKLTHHIPFHMQYGLICQYDYNKNEVKY